MAGDMESTYGEVVEPVGFHCGVGRGGLVVDVGVAGIAVGDVVVLVSSRRYIQNDYSCNTGTLVVGILFHLDKLCHLQHRP